ncbi:MAG TPA: glycosyltransferase, partial [Armatimonadota bacterium]|nr:glycosyltransferase [Armatimonadota bacterium]
MERIDLLGVRIDKVDMQTALGLIEGYMESGMPHLVVTADASAVVIAQKDEEFRNIVNNADMVTPDSTGIIAASRWYHNPLIEKVSGVDLAVQLAKL